MLIRIDTTSGAPIWQQIVSQVTRQAMSGNIPTGERLPTVRVLAADLRVNPNTVARAYQDLERDGIVEARRGAGTFLCDVRRGKTPKEFRLQIEERLNEVIVEALHLNVSPAALQQIFSDRLSALTSEQTELLSRVASIEWSTV
jgi:GntR family transcriptional regulator